MIAWTSPNKHYQVKALSAAERHWITSRDEYYHEAYGVINSETNVIETSADQLPQAIAAAAQFDYMLENDTWEGLLEQLFGAGANNQFAFNFGEEDTLN